MRHFEPRFVVGRLNGSTAIANDIRTRTSSEPAPEPARHVHITVHHPDATTANTAALCIADLIRGEYEGSHRLTITTDASDNSQPDQEQPAPPEPVDWQGILRGFQALLDAFPAELHPGGPAVSCRPQPAGLVARWRDTARTARQQYAADQTAKEN